MPSKCSPERRAAQCHRNSQLYSTVNIFPSQAHANVARINSLCLFIILPDIAPIILQASGRSSLVLQSFRQAGESRPPSVYVRRRAAFLRLGNVALRLSCLHVLLCQYMRHFEDLRLHKGQPGRRVHISGNINARLLKLNVSIEPRGWHQQGSNPPRS
jgi:hypothetical protein